MNSRILLRTRIGLNSFHSSGFSIPKSHLKLFAANYSTPAQKKSHSGDWQYDFQIVKSLAKYLWPKDDWKTKGRVVLAISLLVSGKLLNVTVPFFFKEIVDALNIIEPHSSIALLLPVIIGYGAARLGANIFQEMRNAVFGIVTQRAIRAAARNIFNHLLKLDTNYHLNRQTGGLVRAIDRGTKGINQILSSTVLHIIPTVFEISVVCAILSFTFGPAYALVTFLTMAAYTMYTVITTQWRLQFRKNMNQADNAAASTATDSLLNVESVQQYNNEAYETNSYDKSLVKYEGAAVLTNTSLAILNAGQNAIFSASLTIMMYMASQGILDGSLTVGDLVMVNGLVFQLAMPLNFLGSVYRDTRQSLIDMGVMFDMQKVIGKIQTSKDMPNVLFKGGEIKFENVSFGYLKERPILNNMSFTIPAGKRVAFVGPSGCGKSTILRLVSRSFDPNQGTITLDGQDIGQVNVHSLRDNISILPQDTTLFNKTIYENILYGKPDATEDQVYEAARKAQLHDIILNNFPEKYETHVGERGLMISGGEKQRVQLARIFIKDAPVGLFDEPTSALDQNTETKIMGTIKNWLSHQTKKTAVFIAHRLSTISDCDLIYVLDNGQIIEKGTHQELFAKGGLYYEMWVAQHQQPSE
ncbi:Iron-sulfur clusters transporter atm1, mitochondrial [Terramyces sp. JEL0728]|nr:Iron-sulfur clusters transporter atm1, mitochondrial [Terramyces sp. JEL0728]